MARLSLFTYHVILHPEEVKEGEKQEDSKLIIKPTTVLAKDEQSLAFKVTREIPEEYVEKFERIEIGIAPFSKRTRKTTDPSLTIAGQSGALVNYANSVLDQKDGEIINWNNETSSYDNKIPFTLTGSARLPSQYFNASETAADANI